jgi:hypothetical protein
MEALVGVVLSGFALFFYVRQTRGVWRRHKQLERFEQALRRARENASGPNPWRLPGDADRELVALLDAAESDARALEMHGFRSLGDVIGQMPSQSPTLAMRIFLKDVVVAGIMLSRTAPQTLRVSLSSYGAEQQFTTSRGGDGRSLAMPPWLHVKRLESGTSIADLLQEHTAFLPVDLRVLATLDDVLANIANQRERIQRWRDTQPPDELLEADLRGLLGAHYAKAGRYWSRKLRGKLPDAMLRRG